MRKVLRNELFERDSVAQIATGNASSIFLLIDKESKSQTIVSSGMTTVVKDEKNKNTLFDQ